MTADELIQFTRYNKLRDRAAPPRWTDETILTYLNDGLDAVAKATDQYVDDMMEMYINQGEAVYDLDPSVVFVYSVRIDGYDSLRLQPSTENWTPDTTMESLPVRYTLDRRTQSMRFYPSPDMDYTVKLRVARTPTPLSLDDGDVECELPIDYQHAVMDWAAHMCFSEDDADGRNDMAAEKALKRYNERTNGLKRDNYRLRMGNQPRAHGQRVK